ncbi:MAG TPA: polyphosphate kinase 2 family protein [Kofleriaceae bacterium]|nr:polyphosphate kinase 2 family protein [Kofleriaceae bacterium]
MPRPLVDSPYLVPFDGSFRVAAAPTRRPDGAPKKKESRRILADLTLSMRELQRKLYADDRYSLLLVFQAMDAAGKDGTIRAVMTGINPAGCQVYSFKQPSAEELDHDFLWRIYQCLPERGRIGIFNRSHYEEVLVVRVHPEYLGGQRLPRCDVPTVFDQRLESIRDVERHLARNGTVILKFWLNVSRDEQRERFLARIDEPEANWKFSASDVKERGYWDRYMEAYEQALNGTSRSYAPWYAIPADSKSFMRTQVAQIVVDTMARLDIGYPVVTEQRRAAMLEWRQQLMDED